jgi:hypothetical protein
MQAALIVVACLYVHKTACIGEIILPDLLKEIIIVITLHSQKAVHSFKIQSCKGF